MNSETKICVIMATYNGSRFIVEQINSILNNQKEGFSIAIKIFDDQSYDNTVSLIKTVYAENLDIEITENNAKFGAAGNFLNALSKIDISNYDYIAFSDQDDIWFPDKLHISIDNLTQYKLDAISSDVIAFDDNQAWLIKKSFPERKYDYFFESAGPGCTYVCSSIAIGYLVKFLNNIDPSIISLIDRHDWFIYAFLRHHGFKWKIINQPTVYYRQHDNNITLSNKGFKRLLIRGELLRNKWYYYQVMLMIKLLMPKNCNKTRLNIVCFTNILQLRRRKTDSIMIYIYMKFLILWNK